MYINPFTHFTSKQTDDHDMVSMMADASAVNQVTSCLISHFEELKEKPKRDYAGVAIVLSAHRDHVTELEVKQGDIVFLTMEVESGVWCVSFKNIEGEVPVAFLEVLFFSLFFSFFLFLFLFLSLFLFSLFLSFSCFFWVFFCRTII